MKAKFAGDRGRKDIGREPESAQSKLRVWCRLLIARSLFEEAEPLSDELVKWFEVNRDKIETKTGPLDSDQFYWHTQSMRSAVVTSLKRYDEAEPILVDATNKLLEMEEKLLHTGDREYVAHGLG